MAALIGTLRQQARTRWVRWRRARNLGRATTGARTGYVGIGSTAVACALLAAGGIAVIATHARQIGAAAAPSAPLAALDTLRPLLAGASFEVPERGAHIVAHGAASLAIISGMRGETPVEFDLCGPGVIRIGHRFADVAGLLEQGQLALTNAGAKGIPRVELRGTSLLKVRWEGGHPATRFVADRATDGKAAGTMRADGWLVWPGGALHLWRQPSRTCPAGKLAAQLYQPGAAGSAQVTAYANAKHARVWLKPGSYSVPLQPAPSLEDQTLFDALQARALVRLTSDGLIELAPRDLPAWRAAGPAGRVRGLDDWADVKLDADGLTLLERLYRMADGAYVREQIAVFNSERRLLAWRTRPGPQQGASWQASVGSAPASTASGMPLAGTRLFAEVPSGWGPWQRIAGWPRTGPGTAGQLTLAVPSTAPIEVMLAGRLQQVEGARVEAADACSGRACPQAGAVQVLRLSPLPGARRISLWAAPLDMAARDEQYRHLRVAGGKLVWRALPSQQARARHAGAAAGPVTLADRHGQLLWSGGAPSQAALDAGLAGMLGLHAEHASSIAGMLGRLPGSGTGQGHRASLSLDLAVQTLAHSVLDCVGLRQGRWAAGRCSGAQDVPPGRQAGLAIIDTGSGDILAAAGAGGALVTAENWAEVRDFDRANPARSPLRLPALQHDGGIHRSPGSTFKIVSALGLELAAQRDHSLARLLGGMPLAGINAMARDKGYAFQTAAAAYPVAPAGARITNFRDQHLDRRAQDGRLGLAQALTYSLNTWFAWSGELSDRTLMGRAEGGVPGVRALQAQAFDGVRPVAAMAQQLGFGRPMRLDGGLLPDEYAWDQWDALQATPARIDPIDTRHELRQMAIGLRMQATPLQMALVAGAVGEGVLVAPRLLLELDGRRAERSVPAQLGVRLDRIRAGLKGVVDGGTAAGAFSAPQLAQVRRGLSGKTGTAPTGIGDGATVWFTGYLEAGSLPGQKRRLALAAFVSHSQATGGEHAAPVIAAVLRELAEANAKPEQKGK